MNCSDLLPATRPGLTGVVAWCGLRWSSTWSQLSPSRWGLSSLVRKGMNAPGRLRNDPSTTSLPVMVSRSSAPSRLPRRSTTTTPPGASWEIHAGGIWSVDAVAMIRSNGAATASPAAPSPACTAGCNPRLASARWAALARTGSSSTLATLRAPTRWHSSAAL